MFPLKYKTFNVLHWFAASAVFADFPMTLKVKQTHYKPGQAQRIPEGSGSRFQDNRTHRPPLPPGNINGTHFC